MIDILNGKRWRRDCSDALTFLRGLPDDSIDLLFTSPPYEAARTYGIGFGLKGQAWVDWMVEIVTAAAPKVKGLIAVNCEGQTRNFSYSGTPFLLFADLKRAGFNMRKPAVFHRVGIPGSGGPDWLRNDWEPVICVTRGKLPWSDNTACGHKPQWIPGGQPSYRNENGERVNREKHKTARTRPGNSDGGWSGTLPGDGTILRKNGIIYHPPELANPGNVLKYVTGGGVMGHDLAHENEAPFPLDLAAFFVKSFCPPGGITCDPFSGSGTTCHAAVEHGRRFIGCDVRQSQVKLCERRMSTVTPALPGVA